MIKDYIKLVENTFPSIDPYIAEEVQNSLRQFDKEGKVINLFSSTPLSHISQGDIFNDIGFVYFNKDGDQYYHKTKGLLLTNTCNATRRPFISFSPLLPIEDYKVDKLRVEKNLYYSLMYFPNSQFSEYVVDFNIVSSISRELIEKGLEKGHFSRVASLNQYGYYLLLNKLAVHFMRPEDSGVQLERQ